MKNSLSISFVLPMFNERDNIKRTIDEVSSVAEELAAEHEIIVVDDASTDGSGDIVAKMAEKNGAIKLFTMKVNSRFGGAFAEGFKKASKDVIIYTDSDMPVGMEDIKASFPLIASADIVTGYSRIKKGDTSLRKIISAAYNFTVQMLFGLNIKDINSGYKIVRKEVVEDMEFVSRSPFVDVELFLHARKKGCRIRQFPLAFRLRTGGRSYIARIPIIWATFIDMLKVRIFLCRKKAGKS